MDGDTKVCTGCGTLKPISEYHTQSSERSGKRPKCKVCSNSSPRKNPYDNKKYYLRKKEWENLNKDKVKGYRDARLVDPIKREAKLKKVKDYKRLHTDLVNADTAKRRATKLEATPIFADDIKIKALYKQASDLTKSTGVKYHVDHIVPLRSTLVCGLHWEGNLQIITAEENMKKGNRIWPDMP